MSRRVLLSFLGTNNYKLTHYRFADGVVSDAVRFIQEAAVRKLCTNWDETDDIYVFYTSQSHDKNWINSKERVGIEAFGLEDRLQRIGCRPQIHGVQIDEGLSDDGVWAVFRQVYDVIQDDDILYVDITHAFRSIPLFCSVLFNYARFMKNVSVECVIYGAFEKLGPAKDVESIPIDKRIAPVLDLSSLIRLQEYTDLASGLTKFGRVDTAILSRIGNRSLGETYTAPFNGLCQALEEFDNALTSNRMPDILNGEFYKDFLDAYRNLEKHSDDIPAPLMDVIMRINSEFQGFSEKKEYKNIERAIEWAEKFGMLPLAYTFAREYFVLRLSDYLSSYNPYTGEYDSNRKYRDFLSNLCSVKKEIIEKGKLEGPLKQCSDQTYTLLKLPIITEIRESNCYYQISNNRNIISHGQIKKSYNELSRQFRESYQKCLDVLNKYDNTPTLQEVSSEPVRKVFVNLSNHPSSGWLPEQIAASAQYGEIIDMQFPQVPPSHGPEKISTLAKTISRQILSTYQGCEVTVHLVGEMNFTFAMVGILKGLGIRCVASTTERNATVLSDGSKNSTFKFVRYREY